MIRISPLVVSPIAQNCRVLIAEGCDAAVVIDPGGAGEDVQRVLALLDRERARCVQIWLTHSHLDHCGGVAELKASTGAELLGHRIEREMRGHVEEVAEMFGLSRAHFRNCPEPDRYLEHGDVVRCGGYEFEVRFTPGHSPGHVCFCCAGESVVLCGDTVFAGSIGRTDLPGGDSELLLRSIREQILSLPDTTRLLPGHGGDTTVGRERSTNPFLQDYGRNT